MFEIPFFLFISFWIAVFTTMLTLLPIALLDKIFPNIMEKLHSKLFPENDWSFFSIFLIPYFIIIFFENMGWRGLRIMEFWDYIFWNVIDLIEYFFSNYFIYLFYIFISTILILYVYGRVKKNN